VNASTLLSELRRRDIQVWAVGGELRCNAKAGTLTPELRDELRSRKNEILKLLASAQALATQERAIVPLQAAGERVPVFAVPGHNGDVFCFRALAQCLGDDQPLFGLQPPGLDGSGEPLTRVEDIAGYFAAQIRGFQPQGPYGIAGYCAGGTVAFELAQQLSRGGATVNFVALFGSPYPAYFRFPSQLRLYVAQQAARVGKLARELASRPWVEHLGHKLRQRKALHDAQTAAAADPVLARRAKVERATVSAVRRYEPSAFAGRLGLFYPSRQWPDSAVAARRWRSVSQRSQEFFGPDGCTSDYMLREPNAAGFAELFRHFRDKG
jgi:thioesterase domain-containing protein